MRVGALGTVTVILALLLFTIVEFPMLKFHPLVGPV